MTNNIIPLLIQGKSAKEIALLTGITPNQVEHYLVKEMQARKCRNRVQLAAQIAFDAGKQKHKTLYDYCSNLHL